MPKSWAPEVMVDGQWSRNAVRFRTEDEAKRSAHGLFSRWALATDHRATEADEEPNYEIVDNTMVAIPATEAASG